MRTMNRYLTAQGARAAAAAALKDAERAYQTSEYPRYGRAVYNELAAALRQYAQVVEETEEDVDAPGPDREAKRRRRVARLKRAAAWAKVEALREATGSHAIASRRPFGQPILVGHHSERSHRADLRRQEAKDRRGHALYQKAEELERRARAAEKNPAIYSDDAQAVEKLEAKVAKLEAARDLYKRINAEYRKLKGDIDAMTTVGDRLKATMKSQRADWYMGADRWRPFDAYVFQNMGAEIRRLRKRIEELGQADEPADVVALVGPGFAISEDADWGRILCVFDAKPAREVCRWMRQDGWRWAPSRKAWVRHLNPRGRTVARLAAEKLTELLAPPTPEPDPEEIARRAVDEGLNINRQITEATGWSVTSPDFRRLREAACAAHDRLRGERAAQDPKSLAVRAAAGEQVARPEEISEGRWRAMVRQAACRLDLPWVRHGRNPGARYQLGDTDVWVVHCGHPTAHRPYTGSMPGAPLVLAPTSAGFSGLAEAQATMEAIWRGEVQTEPCEGQWRGHKVPAVRATDWGDIAHRGRQTEAEPAAEEEGPADEPFVLQNDPPAPPRWQPPARPKDRQKMLFSGLRCLPDQQDLFDA